MIVLSERESLVLRLIKQQYECNDLPTVMELSRQSGIYYMDVFRSLQSLDKKGFIKLSHTDKHVQVEPLWWE